MSPRAACRLEALGFGEVYDYVAGKADWLAHNLPVEGERAQLPTAGRLVRDDVVTCVLDDRVGEVRARIERSPYAFALVTTERQTLLGRARRSALKGNPAARIEEVMQPGPTTVRPDTPAGRLAQRLAHRNLKTAIVTTPKGNLLGVVMRGELEEAASAEAGATW
jgi:Mg/Co/Ni transporter MgtE